jgi:hypothetical protein
VLLVREPKKKLTASNLARAARRKVNIGWNLALQTRAGRAHGFLFFWPIWERFTHAIWHLQPVPGAPYGLLEVRFTHYRDKSIDLPDGTHVSRGDPIIDIHFRNRAFLEIGEQVPAWRYMQIVGQNLSALASWVQRPDFPSDAQVIYGVSLLYRVAARLGFMLRPRPKNIFTSLERFFMMGLLVLYHRQGVGRLLHGTTYTTYPQEVWMSRQELLRRYSHSHTLSAEEL